MRGPSLWAVLFVAAVAGGLPRAAQATPPPDVMCAIARGERGAHVEFRQGRLQQDSIEQLTAVKYSLEVAPPPVIVIYAHGGLVDACDAYGELNHKRTEDAVGAQSPDDTTMPLVSVFRSAGAFPIFPIYHVGKLESYLGGVYAGHLATAVEDPRAASVFGRKRRTMDELARRLANDRGHVNERTTLTEENFRYAPLINGGLYTGGRMWSYMKWVIDESFHLDSAALDTIPPEPLVENAPAGIAIAQTLHDYIEGERRAGRREPRVMLVGHSTGSIFLTKFIRAWDSAYPWDPTQFEVVFMAPAIRYDDFRTLNAPARASGAGGSFRLLVDRISHLRIFTMRDDVERTASERDVTDIVHFATKKPRNPAVGVAFGRAVYSPSLLYAISGVLEDHPDTPILGLARFLDTPIVDYLAGEGRDAKLVHDARLVHDVKTMLERFPEPVVLTPTATGAPPGQRSNAKAHMQFPGDPLTQESLMSLIRDGWK